VLTTVTVLVNVVYLLQPVGKIESIWDKAEKTNVITKSDIDSVKSSRNNLVMSILLNIFMIGYFGYFLFTKQYTEYFGDEGKQWEKYRLIFLVVEFTVVIYLLFLQILFYSLLTSIVNNLNNDATVSANTVSFTVKIGKILKKSVIGTLLITVLRRIISFKVRTYEIDHQIKTNRGY